MEKYNTLRTLSGIIIFISWITLISVFIVAGYLLSAKTEIITVLTIFFSGLISFIFTLSYGKLTQLLLDIRENQMNNQTDIDKYNGSEPEFDSSTNKLPKTEIKINEGNDIEDEMIIKLDNLIKKDKKNLIGRGKKTDIIVLLSEIITSKEKAFVLMKKYELLFNKNIISELKSLSSSYNGKEAILSSFIEFEIVDSKYPHHII